MFGGTKDSCANAAAVFFQIVFAAIFFYFELWDFYLGYFETSDFLGEPKVDDFEPAIFALNNVLGLDVPVDDLLAVDVDEAADDVQDDLVVFNLALFLLLRRFVTTQVTVLHKLLQGLVRQLRQKVHSQLPVLPKVRPEETVVRTVAHLLALRS